MKYFPVIVLTALSLVGCAMSSGSDSRVGKFSENVHNFNGDPDRKKNIFVFLDGTRNHEMSGTNVWRLFSLVKKNNDPQLAGIYIKGVGTGDGRYVSGAVLGRGMQYRILRAYQFISVNYKPGDNIFIFGFSRGAHQARSLAGLISYVGVPAIPSTDSAQLMGIGNDLLELLKKKSDSDYLIKWRSWQPDQRPVLYDEIKNKLNVEMQPAEVEFLGVWDTVPGSSLKGYGACKEQTGFVKNKLYWLIPGIDKGERYKTDSYPPIRQIAHAVAIDEKRSKYKPLLLCKPIKTQQTKIDEVWFPGAHSDDGGGYGDSNELPDISLGWMIDLLDNEKYKFKKLPRLNGNAKGLAHWSMGAGASSIGSKCIDRYIPEGAIRDPSFNERIKASPVPIIWRGKRVYRDYPVSCSDFQE